MTETPNLKIPHVGQTAEKAGPINAALDKVDNAHNGLFVLDVTAGGTFVLTNTEWLENWMLRFTGTPGAGVTVIVGDSPKQFAVHNQCGQTITFDTALTAGTDAQVSSADGLALCYSDGENVFVVAKP